MGKRRIRVAPLGEVFAADERRQFHAKIARLCVLYEDMRVELSGILTLSLPDLGVLDSEDENRFSLTKQIGGYRRYYFVRRSIGTLREFAEALALINRDEHLGSNAFDRIPTGKETWDAAIKFFSENRRRLKNIRNDIGGHFGHEAALSAIDNFAPGVVGALELDDEKSFRLRFAGEIAATALLPHLEGNNIDGYDALLKDCIVPSYRHAANCVQLVIMRYLWPAFGR